MTISTLLPGVTLAVVAPGGYAPDEAAYERGIARLQAFGCAIRNYYDPKQKFHRFGGTDAARAAQLHAAASDPDVQVILSLRGGYGMSRLLPHLDLPALARSGKLFVGHSDFTALQMALLAKEGATTFAGPMLCDDFARDDLSEFTLGHFERCLSSPEHRIDFAAPGSPAIDVSGTLWGGNLAMLTHLAGTPYLPSVRDGILFVEDVNEHPFRVERMLLQLHYAGELQQKAIVLGDFSNYRLFDYDNGYDFDAMLAYLRSVIPAPIVTGLPFGHTRDKVTLAVGAQAHLRCDGAQASLTMSGYPSLAQR
ncbi:muramoyltetrapeptide carboxypeptidase [Oxalobacteraceae bacterium OM1]|nr:muramoyltetrapeptide carboxypeptidase [Oxalobacteraceae bacterium OM1]